MLLALLTVGVVYYTVRKTSGAVVAGAGQALQAVNPINPDNIFNSSVNAVGGALVASDGAGKNADGSWTLGGWLYDVTHPEIVEKRDNINKAVFTGGATGSW